MKIDIEKYKSELEKGFAYIVWTNFPYVYFEEHKVDEVRIYDSLPPKLIVDTSMIDGSDKVSYKYTVSINEKGEMICSSFNYIRMFTDSIKAIDFAIEQQNLFIDKVKTLLDKLKKKRGEYFVKECIKQNKCLGSNCPFFYKDEIECEYKEKPDYICICTKTFKHFLIKN